MRRISAVAVITLVFCATAFAQVGEVEKGPVDLSSLIERTALGARQAGLVLNPIPHTPCEAGSLSCSQTANGRVSTDSCNSSNVFGVGYTFTGTAGQRITVAGRSFDFAATVIIATLSGTVLAQDDKFSKGDTATISNFPLPSSGTFLVIITPLTTVTFGDYTLTLTCPAQTGACVENSTTACMLNSRFRVSVRYRDNFDNNTANVDALKKSVVGFSNAAYETSFFYFNDSNNIEMMVKLLDQGNTDSAGRRTIAVLFGSATPLRVQVTITDTQTGASKSYTSFFNEMKGTTDFTAFVK